MTGVQTCALPISSVKAIIESIISLYGILPGDWSGQTPIEIASMLERAADKTSTPPARPVAASGGRFFRDPGEYATRGHLRLIPNDTTQPVLTGIDSEEVR